MCSLGQSLAPCGEAYLRRFPSTSIPDPSPPRAARWRSARTTVASFCPPTAARPGVLRPTGCDRFASCASAERAWRASKTGSPCRLTTLEKFDCPSPAVMIIGQRRKRLGTPRSGGSRGLDGVRTRLREGTKCQGHLSSGGNQARPGPGGPRPGMVETPCRRRGGPSHLQPVACDAAVCFGRRRSRAPSMVVVTGAPHVPAGAGALGSVAAGATESGMVVLRPSDEGGLMSFLSGVTDKSSPLSTTTSRLGSSRVGSARRRRPSGPSRRS